MDIEKKLRRVEQELAYVRAEYEEYCSAISHDFAGPLRAMGGFSEIILSNNEAVFDEKTKRHFDIILNSAKDGKMMLDVTRQFSHLPRSNAPFKDFGIGVPKKMDERIFQILKRAVSPKDYPGHGMGLAIAKKIVHRHGGEIQLLRDVSEQTVFSFTLSKAPIAL